MKRDEPWGLLLLDKPSGITSHTAVERARRALAVSRAGHAGTLDPLASGLLLVGLGRATRLLEYLGQDDKTYRARFRLGEVRDTLDREGRIVETRRVPTLSRAEIAHALNRFLGRIDQVPPAHSAIKKNGEPLHRKARRGEILDVAPRPVQIHRICLVAVDLPDIWVEVECSKGTYVRALARDVGAELGAGGTLWELVRTRSGRFDLAQAVPLANVEAEGVAARSRVLPPDSMVGALRRVVIDPHRLGMLVSGREVPWEGPAPHTEVAVFSESGALVAVARGSSERLTPRKVLRRSP